MLQQSCQPSAIFTVGLFPSKRFHVFGIGQDHLKISFQYVEHRSPIRARALHDHSVQAFSNNHARIASKSRTFVPNRRTSSAGFRWTGPIRMQTSKNFLPTSIPAHRSTLTSSMTLSLRREANAFLSVLPLGLCWAPIGGSFASARPLYLTGFSPKTRTAFSLRPPTLSPSNPSRQGSFSSSEVARR